MQTKPEVVRLLNSVGKEVFVRYFDAFSNSSLSNADVTALLPTEYSLRSRQSRTSTARRILREGLADVALGIIIDSNRLEPETIRAAEGLIGNHRHGTRPNQAAQDEPNLWGRLRARL